LLGREPIQLNQERISQGLRGAVVLVTGAAGSIGSEIVRQLMSFDTGLVILLDQAESALYDLQNDLLVKFSEKRFEVVVASITDKRHMRQVFETYHPQYVFNAAAYKHVPLMESFPYEAIRVNVGGTKLVADLSVEFGVKKFVMISTDKAVNPTNVMGASKRICEIYIQSIAHSTQPKTQFITTRFGNVLGSNGSVVPLFRKQIEAGGPVTITDKDIIRYFMTIPEACQLVLEAGFMGRGGEIYVFDMGEPVKIYDLAVKMISLAGLKPDIDIPITFTGLRPGEKLFEELLADDENTVPTHHNKIKAGKVREQDFDIVKLAIDELLKATQTESGDELVRRMKAMVPEFISQNSKYAKYDEIQSMEKVRIE
jgi:FlaA1/EpsC-like NDP-sugar epimerase